MLTERILTHLANGPATTAELCALLDREAFDGVSATLCNLRRKGRITGRRIARAEGGKGPPQTTLWECAA